jgi:hypothetical protein
MPTPSFLEDPVLATAVAEAEEFVGRNGWDQHPHLFALVVTSDLLAAEPQLAGQLDPTSFFTPIEQEGVPAEGLEEFLARLAWPETVAGCVLIHEIVVLPPDAVSTDDGVDTDHPERAEARLAVGVLRDGSAACVMRIRGDHADTPLRGADLAPNLVHVLLLTLEPDST